MGQSLLIQPIIGPTQEEQVVTGTYGIRIDQSSSDCSAAVVYTEDAANFEALSCDSSTGVCSYGSWKDIIEPLFGAKPCLYKNGERVCYLNPDNYAYDVDGKSVDITSGDAGDVMIEFKRCWYRWRTSGSYLYFEVTGTDMSSSTEWCSWAFKGQSGVDRDYMYYSAFEGYALNSKLRSLSGKTPTVSQTIGTFRTYATANGDKYGQEDIAKRMYIIGLLFLVTKSRQSQSTIGAGLTGGSAAASTGTCNTKGLFYGTSSNTQVAKVFGIENFWGSLWHWCDGFVSGGSTTLLYKLYGPYNDAGTGYNTVSGIYNGGGYPITETALSMGVIAPTAGGGSSSTYYPDYWRLNTSSGYVASVGGNWSNGDYAGPLFCYVNYSASYTDTGIGGRLAAA
jgi:hypothetical protein